MQNTGCYGACHLVQLTVYNYRGGPCYRCIFPTPPPPETVTNCSDGGVLGVGKCTGSDRMGWPLDGSTILGVLWWQAYLQVVCVGGVG